MHPNTSFITDWISRMGSRFGHEVYDLRVDSKAWDWGQAICALEYGPDWTDHPDFRKMNEVGDPSDASVRLAKEWEAGTWPGWAWSEGFSIASKCPICNKEIDTDFHTIHLIGCSYYCDDCYESAPKATPLEMYVEEEEPADCKDLTIHPDGLGNGMFPELDCYEEAVFKWQYGFHGEFFENLWKAICKADLGNQARLGQGFPVEVEGYRRYGNVTDWWPNAKAKSLYLHPELKTKAWVGPDGQAHISQENVTVAPDCMKPFQRPDTDPQETDSGTNSEGKV